ncbi:MAG: ligase-associated DNA damage response exonuclease [Pirellulales bacterium]
MSRLLELTDRGLYCAAGDFYVDPWRPVGWAVITHAHSDHARAGSRSYLTAERGVEILRQRVGDEATIQGVPFGEAVMHNGVRVSLHPAGHILGSAQVRVEHQGEVWVVSGDYKTIPDRTCDAFEPVRCHVFITESTFGLPIYRWRANEELVDEVNDWWRTNQERGRTSVVLAYALGKAQRVLSGLDSSIGPLLMHGAVERFVPLYRAAGIELPECCRATTENARETRGRAMVVAPPSAAGTPWLRKFGDVSLAFASGWMQIRGTRRRRAVDRGFAISDHADWDGLLSAIDATGAQEIVVTHGYRSTLVRWLSEHGKRARALATAFEGEMDEVVGNDGGMGNAE